MSSGRTMSLERDRALVEAMRIVGEPLSVIEDFLSCLDLSDHDREELRRLARLKETGIDSGDVIEMNPLTSQPQRAQARTRR